MVIALWTQFSILLAIAGFYFLFSIFLVVHIIRRVPPLNWEWISRVLRWWG